MIMDETVKKKMAHHITGNMSVVVMEAKLEQMKQAYMQVCQQYHLLANIINRDRHVSVSWLECNEVTCVLQRDFISSVQNNE